MSFIVQTTGSSSSAYGATYTAQNIVDAVSQDIRKVLGNTGADAAILLDYVGRIQAEILRNQFHPFLLSAPQRFYTQSAINNYWIGLSASVPAGAYDTGLNLSDVRLIKFDEVWDRSNNRKVARMTLAPMQAGLSDPDGSYERTLPLVWRESPDSPNLMYVYGNPANTQTWQTRPTGTLVTTVVGGALAQRTYFVRTTLVDSLGNESSASIPATRITIPANSLLKVRTPVISPASNAANVSITGYKVYVNTVEGSETVQNSGTAIALGSDFTEPTLGFTFSGSPAPTTNSIDAIYGNLIEFRYYKVRNKISSLADVLQVPDDYKDIVIAGVNWYAFKYLKKDDEAQIWNSVYKDGLRQITKDLNLAKTEIDYIRPSR